MYGIGKAKMPEAKERRKTPAIPSSAASSSATQNQSSGQPRTTQQGESAISPLHTSVAKGSGSELPSNTTSVPEAAPKADAVANCNSPEPDDPADGVNWHDESSLTRYLNCGYSKKELSALAIEEVEKEMDSWRESYPAIRGDFFQFLGDSVVKNHFRRMLLAIEDGVSDHESDDEDDEDEDDEGSSAAGNWTILPPPQSSNSTSGPDQAVESVAEPPEPDDAASSLDQVVLKGLTFEKALTIATKHEGLSILKVDDDVARVKAQSKMWLPIIMEILDKHYCTKPTLVDLQEVQPTFEPWQKTHLKIIRTHLDSDPQLREAHAVFLLSTVIQRHETLMLKVYSRRDQHGMDKSLKCSERLKLVIAAIEKSAIVGKDVISGDRMDELIDSPTAAVKSKENNKRTNERKKTTEPNKGQDDDKNGGSGAGTHVKRESASDVAKTDEEKLLAGCTFLADIEGDTDDEDGTRFETDEVKFEGAR